MRLNLGCGTNKIPGFINIDLITLNKPDLLADIRVLPFKDESIDLVVLFHTIEHISEHHHHAVFSELWRVLKPEAEILISYPEFIEIAKGFIGNKLGKRDFWRAAIYGRQLHAGDYHVALMHTTSFKDFLMQENFEVVKHCPEPKDPYNTILKAKKGPRIFFMKEELQRQFLKGTEHEKVNIPAVRS